MIYTNYCRILATPKVCDLEVKALLPGLIGKIASTGRLATWRWKGDEATRITYESPCLTFYVNKKITSTNSSPTQDTSSSCCLLSPFIFKGVSLALFKWRCSIDYTRKKNLQDICKTETRLSPPPCVTGSLEKLANPWRGHHTIAASCEWSSKETSEVWIQTKYKSNISKSTPRNNVRLNLPKHSHSTYIGHTWSSKSKSKHDC